MSESLDEGSRMRRTPELSTVSTGRSASNGPIQRPSMWSETSSSSAWSSWGGIMRVGDLMRLGRRPDMRLSTGSGHSYDIAGVELSAGGDCLVGGGKDVVGKATLVHGLVTQRLRHAPGSSA